MSSLLILGAGGHAKVIAETALASGVVSSISFLDDRYPLPFVLGWPVIGPLAMALQSSIISQFDIALVGIGHAATRLFWIEKLQSAGYNLPVLLMHPILDISICSDRPCFCGFCSGRRPSPGLHWNWRHPQYWLQR
ncbi:hypothetical protein [Synechococcus sp. MIT S9504]|uniref:PglD-related sugar-binding protein n=1 Tax=Synechococcus sp. MIT S9504 TaxID=1801628 RepID=UPI0018D367CF|nr:hypothetical protein [Synechococcus sp. MIT S9504]